MKHLIAATALTLCASTTAAFAASPLTTVFISHSSPSNTFWQAVKKGYDDACARVQAQCQHTQSLRMTILAVFMLQCHLEEGSSSLLVRGSCLWCLQSSWRGHRL